MIKTGKRKAERLRCGYLLIVIRLATASPSSGGHGEWSRRDASDIDGLSREAETSGSEKVNSSFGGLVIGKRLLEIICSGVKADFPPGRIGRKHQLANGVEDDLELGVIFVFQRRELPGEFCVREEHLAQTDKCAHDGDVDLHGTRTPQDAGEHGDALLSEGVGSVTAATATAL